MPGPIEIVDLGRLAYADAYEAQLAHHADVLAAREAGNDRLLGRVLTVEHDPVITVSKRPGAADHVLASADVLARRGVAVEPTDRGGDVTYHGPGQAVIYPVLDLKRLRLGLHDHVRRMEQAVIDTLAGLGVAAGRDPEATGVWVPTGSGHPHPRPAKICAIGVRVRRWVTLHGLALNVTTDLTHFALIVPCGLAGRPVTSLAEVIPGVRPPQQTIARSVAARLAEPPRREPGDG